MLFSEFVSEIDLELKQSNDAKINYSGETYKTASKEDIKMWVNESLGSLSGVNQMMWYRVVPILTTTPGNIIKIPMDIKTVKRVSLNGGNFNTVQMAYSDDNVPYDVPFKWDGGDVIISKYPLTVNDVIYVEGVFYPKLVTDDTSVIDIPREWNRLLKLSVLNKHSGRDGIKTSNWYVEYLSMLKRFKSAQPRVQMVGRFTTNVSFDY